MQDLYSGPPCHYSIKKDLNAVIRDVLSERFSPLRERADVIPLIYLITASLSLRGVVNK